MVYVSVVRMRLWQVCERMGGGRGEGRGEAEGVRVRKGQKRRKGAGHTRKLPPAPM